MKSECSDENDAETESVISLMSCQSAASAIQQQQHRNMMVITGNIHY